jgi:hypothetical protein
MGLPMIPSRSGGPIWPKNLRAKTDFRQGRWRKAPLGRSWPDSDICIGKCQGKSVHKLSVHKLLSLWMKFSNA